MINRRKDWGLKIHFKQEENKDMPRPQCKNSPKVRKITEMFTILHFCVFVMTDVTQAMYFNNELDPIAKTI